MFTSKALTVFVTLYQEKKFENCGGKTLPDCSSCYKNAKTYRGMGGGETFHRGKK